ncbi:MAG: hypothetical protein ACI8P9_001033 [Parasphingorhabdus sp.]|jgi:uncharacterized protein YcgI (DUF1989 family)
MKTISESDVPEDAAARKAIKPLICYPVDSLPPANLPLYRVARDSMVKINTVIAPPRDAVCFEVPKGHFFRIVSSEGSQVGDLNLWSKHNHNEKFYAGKTRALHGTHLSTGDRMWSSFPYLRPMATVTYDTLDWYGFDQYGGSVHDVIGTRCDPYTAKLLSGVDYHHCCHSNLTRAFADFTQMSLDNSGSLIHDVLNVFMCTGFTEDTHQYFMKPSPVRPGDYIEFFAETDLIGGLSACPGGDCSTEHSSDVAACFPLVVDIYEPQIDLLENWQEPQISSYSGTHGR